MTRESDTRAGGYARAGFRRLLAVTHPLSLLPPSLSFPLSPSLTHSILAYSHTRSQPKNFFYDLLKKVGELFPGKSKTTRAYLHPEEDVVRALQQAGFTVKRTEMTGTNFYFSRLLEAVRA